jgi:hypothetical protein
LAATPFCVQTFVPDEQSTYPIKHVLPPGLQAALLVHVLHMPLSQTMFVPHGVPLATLVVLPHTDMPVVHDVVPDWQTLPPGLQAAFAVHPLQVPLPSQTWFVPHEVPAAALALVSLQEMPPSTQAAVPTWQALMGGTQGAPGVHAAQLPALQ